jgi:hypothetical protein
MMGGRVVVHVVGTRKERISGGILAFLVASYLNQTLQYRHSIKLRHDLNQPPTARRLRVS